MNKKLPLLLVLNLMIPLFAICSHASIQKCDVSLTRGGGIDGRDLAQFAAYYAASNSRADVDESGVVDSADVAHFAGFFGESYRLPNILLIISDDVGLDMNTNMYPGLIDDLLDLYGPDGWNHENYLSINNPPEHLTASTPALDRLASEAKVFSNAWAHPFCSPTRATIIAGMYAAKTNVKTYDEPMSTNHTTFVQRLKDEANYSTAVFGKWHLAGGWSGYNDAMPQVMGFELFKGHLDSAIPDYWNYEYHVQDEDTTDPTVVRTESAPTRSIPPGNRLPGIGATTFAPVVRGADTIEYITAQEAQNPDKPWFVWLAFNEAHVSVPAPYYHVPNTDTMDSVTLAFMNGCGDPGDSYNGTALDPCNASTLMRAMTNAMDTVIDKVLETVGTIPSDTFVIYIGDNGSWSNNIDHMYITKTGRGKTTPYESGARVPLAISGPGITAGSRSDEFVHAADLFPTILQFAGLEVKPEGHVYLDYQGNPSELDGVSLTPILFGSASSVRDPNEGYLLTEVGWNGAKVGARNATYKVICQNNTSSSNCTFYNLVTDPLEEYPLGKPASCTNYHTNYTTINPEWHYCRLVEVMNSESIF